MNLYLIAYRLARPGQNYEALYADIRSLSGTYWHNTTSSWLVESSLSAKQVYSNLSRHLDGNDEIVVFKLGGEFYGQLQPSDLEWLSARTGLWVSV